MNSANKSSYFKTKQGANLCSHWTLGIIYVFDRRKKVRFWNKSIWSAIYLGCKKNWKYKLLRNELKHALVCCKALPIDLLVFFFLKRAISPGTKQSPEPWWNHYTIVKYFVMSKVCYLTTLMYVCLVECMNVYLQWCNYIYRILRIQFRYSYGYQNIIRGL